MKKKKIIMILFSLLFIFSISISMENIDSKVNGSEIFITASPDSFRGIRPKAVRKLKLAELPPILVDATPTGSSTIELTWDDPENTSIVWDSTIVERSLDQYINYVKVASLAYGVNVLSDTGLTISSTYYYRIYYKTADGESQSEYSIIAYATTYPELTAPSNLVATSVSQSQINLSWNNTESSDTLIIYRTVLDTSSFSILDTVIGVSSYSDLGLVSSTKYYYKLRYKKGVYYSGYSNIDSATTQSILSAPSNLVATALDTTRINLSWNNTETDSIRIERSLSLTNGFAEIKKILSQENYTDSALQAATQYFYRLAHFNQSATSAYSNVASATTDESQVPINITADYWVDLDAGTNGDGTYANPYNSFASLSGLTGGDTIRIKGSTNSSYNINYSGSAGNRIVFDSWGDGNNFIMDGQGTVDEILRFTNNASYIEIRNATIKNPDWDGYSSVYDVGAITLEPGVNNIEIDSCNFLADEYCIQQWSGMITGRNVHHIIIRGCDFKDAQAINLWAFWDYENYDVHHITIENNKFHSITSIGSSFTNGYNGIGIRMQQYFTGCGGKDDPCNTVYPTGDLGSEGVFRDIKINNNEFDSLSSSAIFAYRDHDFVTTDHDFYNWEINNNKFNLVATTPIDIAPISWRGGINHPETGEQIKWSTVNYNEADSSGYAYWKLDQPSGGYCNVIQSHHWSQVLVEGNVVTHVKAETGDGDAFIFDYSSPSSSGYPCDSMIVRYNIFAFANKNGNPRVDLGINTGKGINFFRAEEDCEVYDNLVYGCNYGIVVIYEGRRNNKVFNNTVDDCDVGLKLASGDTYSIENFLMVNNIFSNSSIYGIWSTSSVTIASSSTFDYNLVYNSGTANTVAYTLGSNSVVGDPAFVNESIRDYTIQSLGAGVGAGTTVNYELPTAGTRSRDFYGNLISGDPDIGFYEYISEYDWYVSTSGNSSNTGGSPDSPIDINTLWTVLQPGDRVGFKTGDTFTGQHTIPVSGTSSNNILFGSYGVGNKPIFDGEDTQTYVLRINDDYGYYKFDNLEFKDINPDATAARGIVYGESRANNIEFNNCDFSNSIQSPDQFAGMVRFDDGSNIEFDSCYFTGGTQAIFFYVNTDANHWDTDNITITNSTFENIKTRKNPALKNTSTSQDGNGIRAQGINFLVVPGSSPGTTFGQEGTVRDIHISNNTFDELESTGIIWLSENDEHNIAGRKGYNWYIGYNTFNLVENCAIDLAPISNRGGLASSWNIVEHNEIDSCGYRWYDGTRTEQWPTNAINTHAWEQTYLQYNRISNVASNSGDGDGIILDYTISSSTYKCDSVIVRYNMINNCKVNTTGNNGQAIDLFVSTNSEVYDNIIWDCGYGIYLQNQTVNTKVFNNTIDDCDYGIYTGGDTGSEIYNNILSNNTTYGIRTGGTQTGFDADYNLYYNNGTDKTALATGSNDVSGNPNYINSGSRDYRTSSGGAGIDEGVSMTLDIPTSSTRNRDYAGNSISGTPDIGGYEYISLLPIITNLTDSNITTSSFEVYATINPGSNNDLTANKVRYGESSGTYTDSINLASVTSTQTVSDTIPNLSASTQYFWQWVSNNTNGTVFSSEQTTTTSGGSITYDSTTVYPDASEADGNCYAGTFTDNSSNLYIGIQTSSRVAYIKFAPPNIPQGATIDSAKIGFTSYESRSHTVIFDVSGIDTNQASDYGYGSTSNDQILALPKTVSKTDTITAKSADEKYYIYVTDQLQEIVNRSDYDGKDVAFIFDNYFDFGYGQWQRVWAYDNGSKIPELKVWWHTN